MKKPHMTTAAAILFAIATTGVGVVGAQGNPDSSMRSHHTPEVQDEIHAAIEAGDYTSFASIVGKEAPILNYIHEDNFSQMQELHTLRTAGNHEEARELATELGLKHHMKKGKHKRPHITKETRTAVKEAIEAGDYDAFVAAHGEDSNIAAHMTEEAFSDIVAKHTERATRKAQIDAAIDARDYTAFVEAVGNNERLSEKINETNFAQFAELHDLKEAGDMDAAKILADELGLERPHIQRQKKGGVRFK